MALSPRAQPLFRAQDTATPATYLMPIDPKNWKVPANKVNFGADANPNDPEPRYLQADYIGGVKSSDQSQATANVTVAEELKPEHLAALRAALKAVSGKEVDLDVKIDPAIIGGLVVKLGSRMVDASLRTKLNAMKHAMKEAR